MKKFAGSTINIAAGMGLTLKAVVDPATSSGKFALKGNHTLIDGDELINGFGTKDRKVGTVSKVNGNEDSPSVTYKHLKSEKNTIWFFALTGEVGVVDIISVPIHDHSSVVQGGPAFGTYFSEYT